MARDRKPASDSTHQQLLDAQAPDISAKMPPRIAGDECLTAEGKLFFARLWRNGADKWSEADLWMVLEVAYVQQQLTQNRRQAVMTPALVTLSNGVVARSPIHTIRHELANTLQKLLRDLGIRSRDGAKASETISIPAPTANGGGNVTDFESWMSKQRTPAQRTSRAQV